MALAMAALMLLSAGCVRRRPPPRTAPPPEALYTRSVEERTIRAGQVLWIRVLEPIVAERGLPGIAFSGLIVRDVVDGAGNLQIPHGAAVRLQVLAAPEGQLALWAHSVTVYGNTYLLRPAGESPDWRPGMPLGTLLDGTQADGSLPSPPPPLMIEGASIRVPVNALLLYRLERPALIQ